MFGHNSWSFADVTPPLDPHSANDDFNDHKTCRICGDKALGYNFSVISCESCKAFFRRNAVSGKELRCPSYNNCAITVASRRFCQRCRLRKCFKMGMKKEWIMTEQALMERRRRHRVKTFPSVNFTSTSPAGQCPLMTNVPYVNSSVDSSSVQSTSDNSNMDQPWSTGFALPTSITSADVSMETRLGISSPSIGGSAPLVQLPTKLASPQQQMKYETAVPLQLPSRLCLPTTPPVENITRSPPGSNESDDCVFIPKAVLAALVNQCNQLVQLQKTPTGLDASPPIDQQSHLHDRVFHGLCGTTAPEVTNGVEKYDKCCGTDNAPDSVSGVPPMEECGKAGANGSAPWLALDAQDSLSITNADGSQMGLSLFQRMRMEELIAADRVTREPAADYDRMDKKNIPVMINHRIQGIIRMCKRLSAFKALCQSDQLAVLKGACREILILRGVVAFDGRSDTNRTDASSFGPIPHIRYGGMPADCYEEHKRYVDSFEECWRADSRVMLTLDALTLFYPTRRGVVHTAVLAREYQFYMDLLKSYLHISYDPHGAHHYYISLLDRLEILRQRVNYFVATIFVDVNPSDLGPLLLEVFDFQDQCKEDQCDAESSLCKR